MATVVFADFLRKLPATTNNATPQRARPTGSEAALNADKTVSAHKSEEFNAVVTVASTRVLITPSLLANLVPRDNSLKNHV